MDVFLLPSNLREELKKMMSFFWWESNNNHNKGIYWLNWKRLFLRKEFGGMRFRHLQAFSLVMLPKLEIANQP